MVSRCPPWWGVEMRWDETLIQVVKERHTLPFLTGLSKAPFFFFNCKYPNCKFCTIYCEIILKNWSLGEKADNLCWDKVKDWIHMTREDCNIENACTWVALAVSSSCEQESELLWRRLIVMEATAPLVPSMTPSLPPLLLASGGDLLLEYTESVAVAALVMISLEAKAFQSINAVTHQGVFLKDFVNLEVYIWLRALWSIQFFMVSLRSRRHSSFHGSHLY